MKLALYISFYDKVGVHLPCSRFIVRQNRVGHSRSSRQRRTLGKYKKRRYWPVFSIQQSSPWRRLVSRGCSPEFSISENLSPTWTGEPSPESNPPLPLRRIARTRVAGEVLPDWRLWTIDQLETSPLFQPPPLAVSRVSNLKSGH